MTESRAAHQCGLVMWKDSLARHFDRPEVTFISGSPTDFSQYMTEGRKPNSYDETPQQQGQENSEY